MGNYISREEIEHFQPRYNYKSVVQGKTIKKISVDNKECGCLESPKAINQRKE
jgi:hypothetical protein